MSTQSLRKFVRGRFPWQDNFGILGNNKKSYASPKSMRPRSQILDLFSTFAWFEGDRIQQWLSDGRLRRSMQRCFTMATQPTATVKASATAAAPKSETIWALYWYHTWHQSGGSTENPTQNSPGPQMGPGERSEIAQQHLLAYLQEPCFWAAQKISQRFAHPQYTLADHFQIASSEVRRVIKAFNPDLGVSLKSYAPIALGNILKDYLRQQQAADVCSDWALLRKVSHKRVGEVLQNAGMLAADVESYRFVWTCFKTVYTPTQSGGSERLPKPDLVIWQAIADLYNAKRSSQLRGAAAQTALSPEQIEQRLLKLTQWIRKYLYPAIDSLNKTKAGQDDGEIQDDVADPLAPSLLDAAIQTEEKLERQQQRSQLHGILTTALQQLPAESQEILRLFYQESLSQQELAERLKKSQPTVSRGLKKAEASLLAALLDHSNTAPNRPAPPLPPGINPVPADADNPAVNNLRHQPELKTISIALKEWLISFYEAAP
jgi:RNA polymerase sigma factor (sigma-70 family)